MLLFQLAASDVALGETENWCYLVIDKIHIDLQFIVKLPCGYELNAL